MVKETLVKRKKENAINKIKIILKENKFFRVLLVIQVLALLYVCFLTVKQPYSYIFDQSNLSFSKDRITINENGLFIDKTANSNTITSMATEDFALAPGAYNVSVNYTVDIPNAEASFSDSEGSLNLISRYFENCYSWSKLDLKSSLSSVSQRLYINALCDINHLCLILENTGENPITIHNVQIQEIMGFRILRLIFVFFVFTIFNILYVYIYESENKKTVEMSGIIRIILFSSLPLSADYIINGHDLRFHLSRIMLLAEEIEAGNIWPYIYSTALNGYGYATPLFYRQIFIYIPAILYVMGLSLTGSYLSLIFIVNIVTCLITYYSVNKMMDDSKLAIIGSALYTMCAYRLINVYERAAVGEYLAMTFIPLIICGFYRVYIYSDSEKIPLSEYLPITIGLTGIIQSHLISTEIVGVFIAVFCVIMLKKTLNPSRFIALSKSAILTLLVNSFQLVPTLMSMDMNVVVNGFQYYIEKQALYLIQIFGVFFTGITGSSVPNGMKNEMPLSLGFSLTLGLLLFLICYKWRKSISDKNEYKIASVTFLLTMIAVFLSSTLCYWDSLAMISSTLFGLLNKVQFPWRYLSVASAFAVFCTISCLAILKEKSKEYFKYATIIIGGMLVINTGLFMMQQVYSSDAINAPSNYYTYNSVVSGGEYLLKDTDTSLLNYRNLNFDAEKLDVHDYKYIAGVTYLDCENISNEDVMIEIPLQNYDNYKAFNKGNAEVYTVVNGTNNRIAINVPVGHSGEIIVKYEPPRIWEYSNIISITTVIIIVGAFILEKRKTLKSKKADIVM